MYTGLRAKLKIKPEFHTVINRLHLVPQMPSNEFEYKSDWGQVAEAFPEYPFLEEWARVARSNFIPFGALAYMPWEDDDPEWQRSFKDGIWTFQCSLKNYGDEIGTFVDLILRNIVEEVHELYHLYEEYDEPTHIEL